MNISFDSRSVRKEFLEEEFGSNVDPDKATNVGAVAHIRAAAPEGPRYDRLATLWGSISS